MINKSNIIFLHNNSLYYSFRPIEDPKYLMQKNYKFNSSQSIQDDVIVNTKGSSSIFGPSYSYTKHNDHTFRFFPRVK